MGTSRHLSPTGLLGCCGLASRNGVRHFQGDGTTNVAICRPQGASPCWPPASRSHVAEAPAAAWPPVLRGWGWVGDIGQQPGSPTSIMRDIGEAACVLLQVFGSWVGEVSCCPDLRRVIRHSYPKYTTASQETREQCCQGHEEN